MTRFADQLFDDLMRDHGSTLAHTRVPAAPKRHSAMRPVLLTAGAGGVAVAATVGTLVAGGGTPAYAVTAHPDGTVTLAVYQQSGIAEANAKLHALGDRVVVVPVRSGCPSITSLRAPAVPVRHIALQASRSSDGSVTVDAQGIPAGDILVMGFASAGQFSMGERMTTVSGPSAKTGSGQLPETSFGASRLTSGQAPSCVSLPASPAGIGPRSATTGGSGAGPATNSKS